MVAKGGDPGGSRRLGASRGLESAHRHSSKDALHCCLEAQLPAEPPRSVLRRPSRLRRCHCPPHPIIREAGELLPLYAERCRGRGRRRGRRAVIYGERAKNVRAPLAILSALAAGSARVIGSGQTHLWLLGPPRLADATGSLTMTHRVRTLPSLPPAAPPRLLLCRHLGVVPLSAC